MMVQKARCFNDEEIANQMLETTDPKTHKELGRMVSGFDERVWDERMYFLLFDVIFFSEGGDPDQVTGKLEIVTQGNYHKFTISEDAENLRDVVGD